MRPLPQPDNRLYLGAGGSGKTTLALAHAEGEKRVLVITPADDDAPRLGMDRIIEDRRELIVAMMQPTFRIVFLPGESGKAGWQWANEAAYHAGNLVVVWDEAGEYMAGRPLDGFAYKLWMRGRHRRIRMFACSQRPANVSRNITANTTRAVIFNTTEPDDLAFFRGMLRKDVADAIPSLNFDAHEALDWRRNGPAAVKRAPFL